MILEPNFERRSCSEFLRKPSSSAYLGATAFLWLDSSLKARSGGGDEGVRVELELSVELGRGQPSQILFEQRQR